MRYCACYSHKPAFFVDNRIGLEAQIDKDDATPEWAEFAPLLAIAHLPYSGRDGHPLNIAAFDDAVREADIAYLEETLLRAADYGVDRVVVHCGYESLNDELVGSYERMIDGFRRLADTAAGRKVILGIENMVLREPVKRRMFACDAMEWLHIHDDVARSNVGLVLDTSHASSSVQHYRTAEERSRHLYDFLARPEIICHLHWSDGRIMEGDALFKDLHLIPGDGDLPHEFHRRLKRLDATRTLEQHCSDEDTLRGIAFIESL